MKRDRILRAGSLFFLALTVLLYFRAPVPPGSDETVRMMIRSALPRLSGSAAILLAIIGERFRLTRRPAVFDLAVLLPALLVVLDNLPWYALLFEGNRVGERSLLGWIVLESLAVGLFEELVFRGMFLPFALRRYARNRKTLFLTVLVSSAVFGLVHLFNLIEGAGIGPTLMQVGYSTLIGGMCAIVLIRTGNLIHCVLLHALFDFGGILPLALTDDAPENPVTVVVKVAIAVCVGVWMILLLLRTPPETIRIVPGEEKDK